VYCSKCSRDTQAFAVSLELRRERRPDRRQRTLVDYVMTVAVSVVAGVVAITSSAPSLTSHAVLLSVAAVVLLMLAKLRGAKESGRAFAVPIYSCVTLTYLMLAVGTVNWATGDWAASPPRVHCCIAPNTSTESQFSRRAWDSNPR
jgi:amino acid transporter